MRWLLALLFLARVAPASETAAGLARAIRESTFDRDECYRVRDITVAKEDFRIYLTEGHLIFAKPVAGRRIAAAFTTVGVDGGDAEVLLMPPNSAERRSLSANISSPNLDEHFRSALFLFTGDEYEAIKAQFPRSPANKKAPEVGAILDEEWTPVLRNLGESYQTRLLVDLLNGPSPRNGLFTAVIEGVKTGNFDLVYDPNSREQVTAGRVITRNDRLFYDTWTSFTGRAFRSRSFKETVSVSDYRIEATVNTDLSLAAITRVKVRPAADELRAVTFDITPEMSVSSVTVDGRPAEVLQREALRANLTRGGNGLFLVVPPEPLRPDRTYEFEFHHSGKVIVDAGDHVLYVSSRGNWYPLHGAQFAVYDLLFRYPKQLDLVTPGDVVEERTEGDWRITRRRTSSTIRVAAFNLGSYAHARVEHAGYVVDVCANRTLEEALRPQTMRIPMQLPGLSRSRRSTTEILTSQAPDPLARLKSLASEVAAALEFMASRFGPPALPHLTVSPIPGAFGQGFPGLIYLSTLSYLKTPPTAGRSTAAQSEQLFFTDVLQAHETAHQWWGNRVAASTYRDYWMMEAFANYSALLYLEKTKGVRSAELMLDSYRKGLLDKSESGQVVDSAGPIVLGARLETSQEPRAWRAITYGKGSWIMQMLRRRMGDERFLAMLADVAKRYDRAEINTEQFRALAAGFLPPKSDDPKLESFFEQWVYGTGIPSLKLSFQIKGAAPSVRVVGKLTQTDVDEDFSVPTPIEIQLGHGRTVTQWVRSSNVPVSFTVALKQVPVKVQLDPHYAVLRQ